MAMGMQLAISKQPPYFRAHFLTLKILCEADTGGRLRSFGVRIRSRVDGKSIDFWGFRKLGVRYNTMKMYR